MFQRTLISFLLLILISACTQASTPTVTPQPPTAAPTNIFTPTEAASPTAASTPEPSPSATFVELVDDPAFFNAPCDLSSSVASVPDTVPSEAQPGWNTYQNVAYNFSFSFPAEWTIIEGPHSVCLYPTPERKLLLVIGFKAVGEEVTITRSGVGSGEIVTQGTVRFLGKELTRDVLVEDGKVPSLLYNNASEFTVADRVFTISLDDAREKFMEADISQADQDLVDKIVESFAFTDQ